MKHFANVVLERHTTVTGSFATEPYEAGWASEAIFFVRAEEIVGEQPLLRVKVQISADGIHWADEGTAFDPITANGDYFVRIRHFGGWLRLCGDVQGDDSRFVLMVHLTLKE